VLCKVFTDEHASATRGIYRRGGEVDATSIQFGSGGKSPFREKEYPI